MNKIFLVGLLGSMLCLNSVTFAANYVGNLGSYKFHMPNCRTVPKIIKKVNYPSRDAAVKAGMKPCGVCHP